MSEETKENDNIYNFNVAGIELYHKNAFKKFKEKNQSMGSDSTTIPVFSSFFEFTETEKNMLSHSFKIEENKDYHKILHGIEDDKNKNLLWIKRLGHICSALKETFSKMVFTSDDVIFKLGIFGSESVTSDIDIGVCYDVAYKVTKDSPKISDVVKHFEDCFVKLKYTSLDLDVEMYGDYLKKREKPYLKANQNVYDTCLPYIVAGMLKNKLQAKYDQISGCHDIRRSIKDHLGEEDKTVENRDAEQKEVSECPSGFKEDVKLIPENIKDFLPHNLIDGRQTQITGFCDTTLAASVEKDKLEAQTILDGYVKRNYNKGRTEYYNLLNDIHCAYSSSFNETNNLLSNNDILYEKICKALVYRAESYITPSTVYHVVYEIQNKQKGLDLNDYDYKISALEQLSYFMRFYHQYETETKESEITEIKESEIAQKIDKKNGKYMGRLGHALCKYKNHTSDSCSAELIIAQESKPLSKQESKAGGSRRRFSTAKNRRRKSRNKNKVSSQYKSRHNKKSAARKSKPRRR